MMKRIIIMWVVGLSLLIPLTSIAAPQIDASGGRYTLSVGGEMKDGYYNQNYTANAAAVNLAFTCNCPVVIHQPNITVSVSVEVEVQVETTPDSGQEVTNSTKVSWSIPTERENGDILTIAEIAGYEVVMSQEGKPQIILMASGGGTTEYVIDDLAQGLYQFQVRTVDKDGLKSSLTANHNKKIE